FGCGRDEAVDQDHEGGGIEIGSLTGGGVIGDDGVGEFEDVSALDSASEGIARGAGRRADASVAAVGSVGGDRGIDRVDGIDVVAGDSATDGFSAVGGELGAVASGSAVGGIAVEGGVEEVE